MFRSTYVLFILFAVVLSGCAQAPIAEVGDKAPNFNLPQVTTKSSLKLASKTDRPIVLNFWSTTCSACLQELPDLNKIHEETSAVVIGIALDEDPAEVKRIMENHQIDFEVVMGNQELFEQYDGFGIPYTLILDKHKTIRKRFRGIASHQEIADVIQRIEERDEAVASR